MEESKNFRDLLFELSGEDRLDILQELRKRSANVTTLASSLDLTTQETSRQVSRLKKASLLRKDQRGCYHVTSYAGLVLKQLEGIQFISKHKGYFRTHSLMNIPNDLVLTIGEVTEATHLSNVSQALYSVERLVKKAQEYIWLISDQIPFGVFCELGRALERGTRNRTIQTKSFQYLRSIARDYFRYYREHITPIERRSWSAGTLEDRLDDQVDVFLFVSEKEAAVGFPLNSGRFDYLVFNGEGKRFHEWCIGVFKHYWQKAQPLDSLIEKPCEWLRDNPKALKMLEELLSGQESTSAKHLAPELETMQLTKSGNLTRLGYYAYNHLQQNGIRKI